MDHLATTILGALRRMDAEAAPRADGKITGLWWYGGHARPELTRPQTEVEWSRRLGVLLTAAGYPTRREVPYPDRPRDRCDLVTALPDGRHLWLEVKGAWKDYWAARGRSAVFRSYLLHPLVPSPALRKSHTTALDIMKLRRLGPPHADRVGILLVACETAAAPVGPDLDELERLGDLNTWTATRDEWDDPWAAQRRVHVRLWTRTAAAFS